ncbi:MAG: hypothetical protein COA43_11270 [Robiginitomaculum sp.]|nr:MAG: hypothetical protein COA43_11270 [Robiginitomaculum sp.]
MNKLISFFANMLSGYASYALIAALAWGGLQTFKLHLSKAKTAKTETQRDAYKAASEGKDHTIRTQAQTQARKSKQEEQSNDAEIHVNNADDPVDAALDWLRNNPDKPTIIPD